MKYSFGSSEFDKLSGRWVAGLLMQPLPLDFLFFTVIGMV